MNQMSNFGSGLSAQDERAINAVLVACATGIDQRDWPRFQACFTNDCDADYGAFGKWHGAIALTSYMRGVHASLGPTLHRLSNVDIRVKDDGAYVRSYVDAILLTQSDGGPVHHGVGIYEDQFVRTASGWQIARRKFIAVQPD